MSLAGVLLGVFYGAAALAETENALYPLCPQKDEPCGYVDAEGQWVIKPQFDYVEHFMKSADAARVKINGNYTLIDRQGRPLFEPLYDLMYAIYQSDPVLFTVRREEKYGVIDRDGQVVVPLTFPRLGSVLAKGLMSAKSDGLYGFIDQSGQFVIQPQFERVKDFSANGLALARKDKLWGYIDTSGAWAIAPRFKDAKPFYDASLAPVEIEKKWGYIDATGQVVIPAIYPSALGFRPDGLASVKDRTSLKWGAIDTSGKVVIPFKYRDYLTFYDGESRAETADGQGLINTRGEWIIPPKFQLLGYYRGRDVASFTEGAFWGCVDRSGKVVVPARFSTVNCVDNGPIRVYFNGNKRSGHLSQDGKPLNFDWDELDYSVQMLCNETADQTPVRSRPSASKGEKLADLLNGHIVHRIGDAGDYAHIQFRKSSFDPNQTGFVKPEHLQTNCRTLSAQSAVREIRKITNRSYSFDYQFGKYAEGILAGKVVRAHYTYGFAARGGDMLRLSSLCQPRFSLFGRRDPFLHDGREYRLKDFEEVLNVDLSDPNTLFDALGFMVVDRGVYNPMFGYQHGAPISFKPAKGSDWSTNKTQKTAYQNGELVDVKTLEGEDDRLSIDIAPDAFKALRLVSHLNRICKNELQY